MPLKFKTFMNHLFLFLVPIVTIVLTTNGFASAQESQNQILSESTGESSDLHIASYQENVYVLWKDDTLKQDEIFFRASHDNGKTFDDTINISRTAGDSVHPQLFSEGSHVYVFWVEPQDSGTKLVLRSSSNFGRTFSDPIILTDNIIAINSASFAAAMSDNNLYVLWLESGDESSIPKMILRSSADHGSTFSGKTDLLRGKKISFVELDYPQVAISANNLYASWTGFDANGTSGVFFAKIVNDSVEKISKLSPDGENFNLDHIVVSKNQVFVIMQKEIRIESTNALPNKNEEILIFSNDTGTSFNLINFTKGLKTNSRVFSEAEAFPSKDSIFVRLVERQSKLTQDGHVYIYEIPKNLTKISSSNFTGDMVFDNSASKHRLASFGDVAFTVYQRIANPQHELVTATYHNGMMQDLAILSDRQAGSDSYEPQIMVSFDGKPQVTWVDLARGKDMQYNRDVFFASDVSDNTSTVNLSAKMPKESTYFAINKLDVNYFDTNTGQPEYKPQAQPQPKPMPKSEPMSEPYFEPIPKNSKLLSPLQQFKSGVPIYEIQCKEGLARVIKLSNNIPICVKSGTMPELVKRGVISSTFDTTNNPGLVIPRGDLLAQNTIQREMVILTISPKNVTLPEPKNQTSKTTCDANGVCFTPE